METNDPVQPYSSLLCGPEHHLVENTSYGLVGVLGLEIIDHLCVMLWCDFILKEVGSNVSPGLNNTPNSNFGVTGHKGDISEVREDLQVTSIKSPAYLLWHVSENVTHHSSEGCSAGLDFQSVFLDNNNKIVSIPLCSNHSKNTQFAICMRENSGNYAGCTQHSCQTCLMLGFANRLGLRPKEANTWAMFSGVPTEDGQPGGFYTWQSLSHTTALPINRLYLEMGLHVDSFHSEIHAESVQWNRPHQQIHSTNIFSNSPSLHVN